MNRLSKMQLRQLIIALCFFGITSSAFAQKQSKTFKETFNVGTDAVLDINTSYADIEFETWDKDIVAISATATLEGATDEEAEKYFRNEPFDILGNSKKIEITSRSSRMGLFSGNDFDFDFENLNIEVPDMSPFIEELADIVPFPEVAEIASFPMTKTFHFDYSEYKKDGEKYMKKWQKEFEKSFDKDHLKKLEEWGERMEKRGAEMEKRMEKSRERRQELMEKRAAEMEKRAEEREERFEKMHQRRATRNLRKDTIINSFFRRGSLRSEPNIFYFSSDGENKNYKIKKTIKIKLPKSTRIKMNVRHGEVKLAENTKNLNATLSHSSLWAATISGDQTNIEASYSPVEVKNWNYGQLQTKYSKDVNLAEVLHLQLSATSSEVTIDKLLNTAYIKNDFGPLHIIAFSDDFKELDVSLKNAEMDLGLPKTATTIYVKGNSSKLKTPASMRLNRTVNGSTVVNKGFHLKQNSGKSIIINSDYSDVVLH